MKKKYTLDHSLITSRLVIVLSAALMTILSIPHTMAMRNILLALSIFGLFFCKLDWGELKGRLNFFYLFCLYLVIHVLLFSADIRLGWQNFIGEWLKFIIYFVLGLGVALINRRIKSSRILLLFAIAFTMPLLVHLIMMIAKWMKTSNFQAWGYLGLNSMHGELGYTSLMAVIFLSTYSFYQAKKAWEKVAVFGLMVCSLVSPLIALGRGSFLFSLISLVAISAYKFHEEFKKNGVGKVRVAIVPTLLILLIISFVVNGNSGVNRWENFYTNMLGGVLSIPTAMEISCGDIKLNGEKFNRDEKLIASQRESLLNGDASRILGAITGLRLIVDNPMGINQSRQAYSIALAEYCGKDPALRLSHSHNGWINVAMAIGLPGMLILMYFYMHLINVGRQKYQESYGQNIYGLGLMFLAVIWLLRGLFDGTMQDQMLEMQAFSFALLFGLSIPTKIRL